MDYRISEEHTWHDRRYDFFKQKVGWCSHVLSDSIHHENKVIRHRPHCTKYYNKCIDLDDAIKVYGYAGKITSPPSRSCMARNAIAKPTDALDTVKACFTFR